MKKRTLRSNQETDEGKRCAALANSLTKKAPYKGLGAESEEKREPVSDIDTGVVDSLKALDPDGRLEKRARALAPRAGRFRLTRRPQCLALHWATAAPSAKGLGAANLLIVACDT